MAMCQNGKDFNQTTSCTGNIASKNIHVAVMLELVKQNQSFTALEVVLYT